jgi:outer membrane immunogenic protein
MMRALLASIAALAIAGTASAADFPVGTAYVPFVVPPFNWTSCYLGGYVGKALANRINVVDTDNFAAQPSTLDAWSYNLKSSLFGGGGTAGCNWQPSRTPWMVGIEGEGGYFKLSGSGYDPLFPLGSNVLLASTTVGNGYAMATVRLGYAVDRVLFYLKGGAAFSKEGISVTQPAVGPFAPFVASASGFETTGTLGGGIEWAFAYNWTLKGEYMFIGSNTNSVCGVATAASVPGPGTFCWNHSGLNGFSTAKIGVNYLFGAGEPAVARY